MQKPYESLKYFYLGGDKNKTPYLYNNKDLTTHALIVGMTGSGKTGLGISLIEEAAIDNIPSIVIDPKGDMGNLLLAFPNLSTEEFKPWMDENEAANKNISVDELAENTADSWKNGLNSWDQDESRVLKYKNSADFTIYTPGASHGVSVSILSTFKAPSNEVMLDNDLFSQIVNTTVTGILSFVGVKNIDPLSTKEHIFLSSIFMNEFKNSKDISIEDLIHLIITPSFDKVGVFALEKFFPQSERTAFAMRINSIIASPTFSAWCEGEPLDIGKMLFTKEGKAKVSIFSISHLSDSERMFFVTLLLNAVIGWMRGLDGTSSLRAILYMDEIFGFFPPSSNPPSKLPMLTLLKQARAFGVGVVLSTQNPVDIDYKGLSNIGTWFIGRLQTAQDKERVISGLSGVTGSEFTKNELMDLISSLDKRFFLVKNINEDGLKIIQTRWALSYLKGPLSREQVSFLMKDKKETKSSLHVKNEDINTSNNKPLITAKIEQFYFYETMTDSPRLEPYLAFFSKVRFVSTKNGIDKEKDICITKQIGKNSVQNDWIIEDIDRKKLLKEARKNAQFGDVESFINIETEFKKEQDIASDFIYRNIKHTIYSAPSLKLSSNQDESMESFRERIQTKLNEQIDTEKKKLQDDFAKKDKALDEKLLKANVRLEKEKDDMKTKALDTALTFGSSILGALFGKGKITATKATSGAKGASRVLKERGDIKRVEDEVALIEEEKAALKEKFRDEANAIGQKYKMENIEVKEENIILRKSDIYNTDMILLWKEV